ncbi:hypothetical protein HY310_02775 [Candidatus Microgenomates bacterium]|nr:hypothetical protein [Candidatus Microgenomates bacterium]
MNKSSTASNVITILLLIFFLPVGLIVMWFWPKWNKWVKALITAVGVLMIIVSFFMIATLSAIALVGFSSAANKAKAQYHRSNVNTIKTALEFYYADRGYYPYGKGVCNGTYGIRDLLTVDYLKNLKQTRSTTQKQSNQALLLTDGADSKVKQLNNVGVCGLETQDGFTYYYSGGDNGSNYTLELLDKEGEVVDLETPKTN